MPVARPYLVQRGLLNCATIGHMQSLASHETDDLLSVHNQRLRVMAATLSKSDKCEA